MKHLLLFIAMGLLAVACTRNAITGKSQLTSLFVSEADAKSLALTEYGKFLSSNKVVAADSKQAEMVKRVGSRIAAAITKYYKQQGKGEVLKGYKWEFNLVESKDVNAWCMPGGKVVVYTGLLPFTQNETALAIVLGHEIAHAVIGHGLQRLNNEYLKQGIQVAGNVALGSNAKAVNIFNTVYSPGADVAFMLPNSRAQELEADHYGLLYAAMAGYDPKEAIPFWKRMMDMSKNAQKPPIFLSDHPADSDRITKLEGYIPEALTYYKP